MVPRAYSIADSIRRLLRWGIGYDSSTYRLGSAALRDISLLWSEGFRAAQTMRALLNSDRGPPRAVKFRGLLYPIWIRPGTVDAHTVINNVVREEYGIPLPTEIRPLVIVDAGAFIGDTSAYFLSRFKDAQVISIEPSEENYSIARQNLMPYGERSSVLHAALWWESGQLRFTGESVGGHLSEDGVSIPAIGLSEITETIAGGHIDILKMDIEGAEGPIFANVPKSWFGKVDHIVVELHGAEITNEVLRKLQDNGFKCKPYRSIWHCYR